MKKNQRSGEDFRKTFPLLIGSFMAAPVKANTPGRVSAGGSTPRTQASAASNAASAAPQQQVNSKPAIAGKLTLMNDKKEINNLLERYPQRILVIDFFAGWCAPCKLIHKVLEELAEKYFEQALFIKVDVEEMEDFAMEMNVATLPALLFLKGKIRIELYSGSDAQKVKAVVEKHLDRDAIQTVKKQAA